MEGTTIGGWMKGMMTGVVLNGMKIANGCVVSERVKAVDTFLANFDRERAGNERFNDWITDVEALHFHECDENGCL